MVGCCFFNYFTGDMMKNNQLPSVSNSSVDNLSWWHDDEGRITVFWKGNLIHTCSEKESTDDEFGDHLRMACKRLERDGFEPNVDNIQREISGPNVGTISICFDYHPSLPIKSTFLKIGAPDDIDGYYNVITKCLNGAHFHILKLVLEFPTKSLLEKIINNSSFLGEYIEKLAANNQFDLYHRGCEFSPWNEEKNPEHIVYKPESFSVYYKDEKIWEFKSEEEFLDGDPVYGELVQIVQYLIDNKRVVNNKNVVDTFYKI